MKEIKTVQRRCDDFDTFDKEVNDLLEAGWKLVDRFVMPPYEGETYTFHRMYVAYLEREIR